MKEETLKLQRQLLGSIDLPPPEDKTDSEQERVEYCAAIFAVYPRIEKDIKDFLNKQLMFSSMEAQNWEQVIFGRGTFNGMALLLEHWNRAQLEYIDSTKNKLDDNSDISLKIK